jgi:uncharacterized ferritin-like protein (DUF455 family)
MKLRKEDLSLYVGILHIKMEAEGFELSPSVRQAIASFSESEKVHALDIIKRLLTLHREYGNYLADK